MSTILQCEIRVNCGAVRLGEGPDVPFLRRKEVNHKIKLEKPAMGSIKVNLLLLDKPLFHFYLHSFRNLVSQQFHVLSQF